MKKLKLEVNSRQVVDNSSGKAIMITPPINAEYWAVRVHLYEDQYIQAFPKFSTYGIGFAIEEDWNSNLPFNDPTKEDGLADPTKIRKHIWHNRRYVSIKPKRTERAIRMIQEYIRDVIVNG